MSIPDIYSTLILSITDSLQTVNDTIIVNGLYNVYNYTDEINLCNVYTFKLTLPKAKIECNEDIKIISTGIANLS